MAHGMFCSCKGCYKKAFKESSGKSKGGMHVGRPHTSRNDPRIHVTSTLRNSSGRKTRQDQHHTSLGAIAYGQANYDTRNKRRK